MQIRVNNLDNSNELCIKDLIFVYKHPKMYINEKKYLTSLIEILFNLGYYDNGSITSLFEEK